MLLNENDVEEELNLPSLQANSSMLYSAARRRHQINDVNVLRSLNASAVGATRRERLLSDCKPLHPAIAARRHLEQALLGQDQDQQDQ